MEARTQHYHRCQGCEYSWTCYSATCDAYALCEDCEKARFEQVMEQRGFTVSQPDLPELDKV